MWSAALCFYSCFFGPRWETNSCKKCWRCLSEGVSIDWWTPRNPQEAVEERFQMYPGTNSWSTNGQNHDWGGLVLTWNGLLAVAMAEVSEGNKKNHLVLLRGGNRLCHRRQKRKSCSRSPTSPTRKRRRWMIWFGREGSSYQVHIDSVKGHVTGSARTCLELTPAQRSGSVARGKHLSTVM